MKPKRRGRLKLLAVCYLAALLVWLGFCGVLLARDTWRLENGTLRRAELSVNDFAVRSGVHVYENGDFVSTDPDPQLIYAPGEPFYATRFVFRGAPLNRGAGEMTVYYTTAPHGAEGGPVFSDRQKLWARQMPGGAWYFDFDGKLLHALRFDPDSMGGVYWASAGFVLNERIAPAAYFVPDAQQAALLLLLPLLCWGVLSEISAWVHPIFARRRFEKRFKEPI